MTRAPDDRPAPPPAPGVPAAAAWQLRLLGAAEARCGARHVGRWPSRAVLLLLARLALAPQRSHPREELVELLWPGVAIEVGRNRLRQALSTLRSLLEADRGVHEGPVIDADRFSIRLHPGALDCDALAFERAVRHGQWDAARQHWAGELLPGHYDEWVQEARAHLNALHDRLEAQPSPAPRPLAPEPPLPASWTRVFGIEHSATRLLGLLRQERLVTLVGPGGSGKTRLALEVARAWRDAPGWTPASGAAWPATAARALFVPLVDCVDAEQARTALAHTLQVGGRELMPQLQARLGGPPTLLVLDNFEQLVAPALGLVLQLLEAVPTLHLLVTSRLRLGLPGEHVMALRGLPLPDEAAARSPEAARLNPAVALFVDRARALRPDFPATEGDWQGLCELVRRLDGLPLALELAASRVASFSPAQMLQLLRGEAGSAHLQLLARSGPRAGHDPRHASMAAVIDWSWRLLGPEEQALMTALCACAGPAGPALLAALQGLPQALVAARLDTLLAHSMVQATPTPAGQARFAVLEPVREFVIARDGEGALRAARHALARALRDWARALGPAAAGHAVEPELRHVQAVLGDGQLPAALRLELLLALHAHWESAGLPASLQGALESALATLPPDSRAAQLLAGDAHDLLAYLRFEAGFTPEALAHAEAAHRLAGDDLGRRARAQVRRAWIELAGYRSAHRPGPESERLQASLQDALALAECAGDREAQARALQQLATLRRQMAGDSAEAERLFARAEALWTALGNRRKAAARLRNRAQCWMHLGRVAEARACLERCEREAEADGDDLGRIDSLLSLASLHLHAREWPAALALASRCLGLCWQRWHRHGLAYVLWIPPLALARLRRPEQAQRLMAFAAQHWQQHFGPLSQADARTVRRVDRLVRAQRGAGAAQAWWDEGQRLTLAQAVALAQAQAG